MIGVEAIISAFSSLIIFILGVLLWNIKAFKSSLGQHGKKLGEIEMSISNFMTMQTGLNNNRNGQLQEINNKIDEHGEALIDHDRRIQKAEDAIDRIKTRHKIQHGEDI